MKKMLDLAEVADLLRRNAGHWMMVDADGYRSALSSRATAWKRRPPAAFGAGRFEFSVRKDPELGNDRIILWGRHVPATFPR